MSLPFELFNQEHTAVIVIDKQYTYVDVETLSGRNKTLSKESQQSINKLDKFIVQARKLGVKIFWTQMTEDAETSPKPISTKITYDRDVVGIPVIGAKEGQKAYEIVGLQPNSNEVVIKKYHYDSFSEPSLHESLQREGVTSVVLTGGFASRCVLGTAYGANSHDYFVLYLKDLVVNPDQYANEVQTAERIIDGILGYVGNSEELLASWRP